MMLTRFSRNCYSKITRPGLVIMPKRKIQIANGEFYHIIKRGVEEREIYLDDEDHFRFINSLLVFNDKMPAPWQSRAFWHQRDPDSLSRSEYKPRTPLVEIHCFVLMPNHFHLLVRQLAENGIATLMQKLGGFSYYFNKKHSRGGILFQDRYKIIHIRTQYQLKNNFVYIHTNPVALIEPEWKEWKVRDPKRVLTFLEEEYPWSSYWDYIGKKNFLSLIQKEFFLKLFNDEKGIKKEIEAWIRFKAVSHGIMDMESWE